MITTHHGDNLDILPTLRPASVQALISSPPFFGLRRYEIPPSAWPAVNYSPIAGLPPLDIPAMVCQLGAEPTPEAYTAHIVHTMRLARGALRGDGTVMLNFGDSYAQDSKWGGASGNKNSNSLDAPRDRKYTAVPDKNLLLIPARVALALQADGWILRNDAIWHKPNCMPESVRDRFTRSHEYCFVFAKAPRYFWDDEGEDTNGNSHGGIAPNQHKRWEIGLASQRTTLGSAPTATRNRRTVLTTPTAATTLAGRCEACRGTGYDNRAAAADPAVTRAPSRKLSRELRDRYPCGVCGATGRAGEEHYAMWPPALVEIFVRALSAHRACEVCGAAWRRVVEREQQPRGDAFGRKAIGTAFDHGHGGRAYMETVSVKTTGHAPTCDCPDTIGAGRCVILDPYAGSGTTGVVCERLGRDSVLIDLGYTDARSKRTDGIQVEMEALW